MAYQEIRSKNEGYVRYWLDFLLTLTKKEIKARYKRTKLGILWSILNPFFQMLIMGFVFNFFVPIEVDNYFLFLFTGLLPWNFFTETVSRSVGVFVEQRYLIAKTNFPRESLVLSIVLANLFHTLIATILLLIYLLITQFNLFSLARIFSLVFTIPFLLIYLSIFTTGFSFLVATLNVRNRDVGYIIKALLTFWFYATPIVYNLKLIPNEFHFMFYLNPMTGIVEFFRAQLLRVEFNNHLWFFGIFFLSICFTIMTYKFFRRREAFFDDYL